MLERRGTSSGHARAPRNGTSLSKLKGLLIRYLENFTAFYVPLILEKRSTRKHRLLQSNNGL